MCRSAFTLLELLIAIALVAMVAGIVLPVGASRLAADRFDQAQRQVASAVIIARADAQRRGVIVRLTVRQDERGATLWSEEAESAGLGEQRRGERPRPARSEFVLDLPRGVRFALVPAEDDQTADAERNDRDAERDDNEPEFAEGAGGGTLCVLLPDGSVLMPRDLLMVFEAGDRREVRIRLNRWTGEAAFTPFVRAEGEPPPPSAPDAQGAAP